MSDLPTPPEDPGRVSPAEFPPVPPPELPPVPVRRLPVWVVAVAIVAVLALLGGLFAVVTGDDGGDNDTASGGFERDEATTTQPDDPGESLPANEFEDVVEEIEEFVAAERGLPFLRDVTVELADDAEFERRLTEDFEEDVADLEATGQVLQALGLVEPGTDVVATFRSLLEAGVVGFYDPETDELVVRGTEASPYVRTVIAHELTHALDDQHFELDRPALDDATDESGFGFTALVEGNASSVEAAYRATFSPQEEAEAAAEELALGSGFDFDALPLVLIESIGAPYILGPQLIKELLDAGGQARLDAAFVTPPTTSEAVLVPSIYIDGQPVVAVPAPTADGPEIERGTIGALGLAQILGEASFILAGIGELSKGVEGWGGDAYVAWTDGDRACLRANLVGDTPEDTSQLATALEEWAQRPPFDVEATVAVTDVVTLTSCG